MKDRPGFIIYFETMDSLEEYTNEETGSFLRAASEYSRYGSVPDFEDRGLRSLWKRTMNDLNRDNERYQKVVLDNAYKGYVSAEKRKYREGHPMGEAIEGRDYLSKEEWLQERQQRLTAVDSGQPTTTSSSTSTPAPSSMSAINASTSGSGKGVEGETLSAAELRKAWQTAMTNKDMKAALDAENRLFYIGYVLDKGTGEITRR